MKKCTVCGEIQQDEKREICDNCHSPLIEIPDIKKEEEKKKKYR